MWLVVLGHLFASLGGSKELSFTLDKSLTYMCSWLSISMWSFFKALSLSARTLCWKTQRLCFFLLDIFKIDKVVNKLWLTSVNLYVEWSRKMRDKTDSFVFQIIILRPAQLNLKFFFRFENWSSSFKHQICVQPLLYSTHGSWDTGKWLRFDIWFSIFLDTIAILGTFCASSLSQWNTISPQERHISCNL